MAIVRGSSPEQRAREWRTQLRLRSRIAPRFARMFYDEVRRTGEAAAQAVLDAGTAADLDLATWGHEQRIRIILERTWRTTAEVFGGRVFAELGKSAVLDDLELKDSRSQFERSLDAWIRDQGAEEARGIGDTTKSQIRDATLAGVHEGEGQDAIARRIRDKTSGLIGRRRSRVIARTEVHNASTFAQDQAVASEGLGELEREWVSAIERSRTTHIAANGQRRKMGEKFQVGRAKLDRPGDPRGPAGEVINCRCVLVTVIPDPDETTEALT